MQLNAVGVMWLCVLMRLCVPVRACRGYMAAPGTADGGTAGGTAGAAKKKSTSIMASFFDLEVRCSWFRVYMVCT